MQKKTALLNFFLIQKLWQILSIMEFVNLITLISICLSKGVFVYIHKQKTNKKVSHKNNF